MLQNPSRTLRTWSPNKVAHCLVSSEGMHHSTLAGLWLVGATLLDKEAALQPNGSPRHHNSPRREVVTQRYRSPQHDRLPRRCSSPRRELATRRSRLPYRAPNNSYEGDASNNITQQRVNRSRYERDKHNYMDEYNNKLLYHVNRLHLYIHQLGFY
jgi:hypothetical protein